VDVPWKEKDWRPHTLALSDIAHQLATSAPDAIHYLVHDTSRHRMLISRLPPDPTKLPSDEDLRKDFSNPPKEASVLLAYSTARNRPALDGAGNVGPYAQILSEEIIKPGFEAVAMFRRVQLRVKALGGQEPELIVPVLPEFYFGGEEVTAAKITTAPEPKN
jgi:hypothetical protein